MLYLLLVILGAMFVAYKCSWKHINEILSFIYVGCLAIIIVVQHLHIVELERKAQESAKEAIEQNRAINKLSVMVYQFLDSIKKEQAWRDVAPSATLPEYLEASRAEKPTSIVATEPLIEVKSRD